MCRKWLITCKLNQGKMHGANASCCPNLFLTKTSVRRVFCSWYIIIDLQILSEFNLLLNDFKGVLFHIQYIYHAKGIESPHSFLESWDGEKKKWRVQNHKVLFGELALQEIYWRKQKFVWDFNVHTTLPEISIYYLPQSPLISFTKGHSTMFLVLVMR